MKFSNKYGTVSLVVTSCKRHDLLFETLSSFVEYNTYPIKQVIVVEDSEQPIINQDIINIFLISKNDLYINTEFVVINNAVNIGQMKSIDKAYELVSSDYIFHCEDDWCFYKTGFIEESMKILESDDRIFTVWLRAYDDLNGHTVSDTIESGNTKYRKLNSMGIWTGFTLNPGLRSYKNSLIFGPYSKQEKLDKSLKHKSTIAESDLAIKYANEGFFGAVTEDSDGFVKHSGYGRHISNPWEYKIVVKVKNLLRRIYGRV